MNSKINYRPDIDGLRAVAVLSVVFYHAGIKWFSGGYVGVDVFFVISGYLITTIIIREIEAKEFSLAKFYERRIRRIFPALYAVIPAVLLAAFLFYPAQAFATTGKSAAAATLFASNILFWNESGYFAAPTTLLPLLHTWSLAVEEQFYIVFPLLMILVMRYAAKWRKFILGGLALASFLASIYFMSRDASAAFYFFHLRAWELLIGGLLALQVVPASANGTLRNLCAAVGLAFIMASVFLYTEDTAFPGVSALLPTLGAASIIYAGINGDSFVGKVLGLPPFVFIGKISYSLYLWHWPIITFGKYYAILPPTWVEQITWLVASFSVSVLSWQFIERPFRSRSFLIAPKIFIAAGSVMILTLTIAGTIDLKHGLPGYLNNNVLATPATADSQWQQSTCDNGGLNTRRLKFCRVGTTTSVPSFLLWGDSHASALAPAVDQSARKQGLAGYLATDNACPPLLDVDRAGDTSCSQFNSQVLKYLKAHSGIQTVVLAGKWALSAEGTRYKSEEGTGIDLVDLRSNSPAGTNAAIFEAGLDRTTKTILDLNRNVVIVLPIPEVGFDVPSSYFIALRTGRNIDQIIAPTFDEYLQRNRAVFNVMDAIQHRYHVQLLDPAQMLCNQDRCQVVVDGNPLYQDSHHLSIFGSLYVSSIFDPLFVQLAHTPSK